MAKSEQVKVTPEERLQKSLAAAAKILNKKMHTPPDILALTLEEGNTGEDLATDTIIHQVWCPDENIVIGNPTTDITAAQNIRTSHNQSTGHLSRLISSS